MRLICKSKNFSFTLPPSSKLYSRKRDHSFLPVLCSEVMSCRHLMWGHKINRHFQNGQCWLRIIPRSHANEEITHLCIVFIFSWKTQTLFGIQNNFLSLMHLHCFRILIIKACKSSYISLPLWPHITIAAQNIKSPIFHCDIFLFSNWLIA